MKINRQIRVFISTILGCFMGVSIVLAASPTPELIRAKNESEIKGLVFITSHDEIESQAKKEGKLHALSSMEYPSIVAMEKAFKIKYPFLDVTIEETTGTDANRRFLLEINSGRSTGIDAAHLPTDMYQEFLPIIKKYDLIGMAKHGVINVPIEVIDQENPYILSATCNMQVSAYNKKLISRDQCPNTWEDFLKPQFKGKKFVVDIRPTEVAALVPAWGIEKVLDFARKIAEQNPVWARGGTRTLTAMTAGEYALFMGPNYHATMRVMKKDPTKSLGMLIMEPIPVRPTESVGVLAQSENAHAALLWLEFLLSRQGQKIVDENEYGASLFVPGSSVSKVTKGKKVSLANWKTQQQMPEYQRKIIEAYGFPKAQIKRKKK